MCVCVALTHLPNAATASPKTKTPTAIVVFLPYVGPRVAAHDARIVNASVRDAARAAPSTKVEPRTAGPAAGRDTAKCATDAACLVIAGKRAGARWVASGSLLSTGTGYRLVYVIVDVQTSALVDSSSASFTTSDLATAPGKLVFKLLGATGDPPTPPTIRKPRKAIAKTSAPEGQVPPRQVTVGIEFGGLFPQLMSKLGLSPSVAVELGYLAPILSRRLGAYVTLGYAQPSYRATAMDPRLAGEMYTFDIQEQHVLLNVGAVYRLYPPAHRVNAYGQLGLRVDMQRSTVNGDAGGATFGENRETATKFGVHAAVGGEYRVGPGAVAAELELGASDLNQFTTGNSTSGGIAVLIGYHLFF